MKHKMSLSHWVVALGALWGILTSSANGQIVVDGLIGSYPFDGNANDSSGNGHNGSVNGATPAPNRFGDSDMAYAFNGSSSFIGFNFPNLPTGASPRTVSLWAAAQPDPTKGANLFFWGANEVDRGFGLMNNGSPYIWDAQAWGNDVHSGVLVDSQWHQLVVVYDGNNLSIAIDGVQKASGARSLNTPLSDLTVGAGLNGEITFYRGVIDDLHIYSRALSIGEIQQQYAYERLAGVPELSEYTFTFSLLSLGLGAWLRRRRSLDRQ